MKKIVLLFLILFLTGCKNVTHDVFESDKVGAETVNLIIDEESEKQIESIQSEENFVVYLDSINYHVDALTQKESITVMEQKTLENTFITLTDFIFYNGTINGKTFNELTLASKEKILDIYEKIDQKIENKIPGYKDKIVDSASKTYSNLKERVFSLKNSIKNEYIEDYGYEKYEQLEQSYNEGKDSLKEACEETSEVIVDVTSDFYEDTKNKAENWYKNYKESRN